MRKTNLIAAAVILSVSGAASALDFNANVEVDNTFRSGSVTKGTGDAGLTQGGRVELNASGKAGTNAFVAGKATFTTQKGGGVGTDDMWVQVGTSAFDVKLGRFEGKSLFETPGDTVANHAGAVYTASALRGRKGNNVFHAALTGNLGGGLSAELGFIETKTAGEAKGVRPVISYANGPLALAVGFESGKFITSGNKVNGFGLTAAYDFGGFKLTGDISNGKIDAAANNKASSYGLVAGFGPAALGLIGGKVDGGSKTSTIYGSYNMPLFGIKGASITPAFSTSKSGTNKDNSIRVRINYGF